MTRFKKRGAKRAYNRVQSTVMENSSLLGYQGEVADSAVPVLLEGNGNSHDKSLMERAWTQWQFGAWEQLTQLSRQTIETHPNRAELALLIASAHAQVSNDDATRQFIRLAKEWGCSYKLINNIFASGVYNALARVKLVLNQIERAQSHVQTAVRMVGAGEPSLIAKARLREQQEQLEKRNALHLADILNRRGESFYHEGRFKEAIENFHRAFELNANSAWYCQNLAEAVARLDAEPDNTWQCGNLVEAIASAGKWDVAVRLYRQALKLNPTEVEYHQRKQLFRTVKSTDSRLENPIFIVGCGHSGTSLMLAILGSHPNFYPIPKESALFLKTDVQLEKTMQEWDDLCHGQGKTRWIEKTPPHIFQMHRFLAFRPQSKFILMLRDGRDVVCSLKSRVGYMTFSDRLDRWVYDNMAGLPYWQHPQVMVVKYEDLVAEPERILGSVCQFLGEEYSVQMLEYHKSKHLWYSDKIEKPDAINTNSDHVNLRNWQINQPLFDGRGRWLNEMTDLEKMKFKNSPAQTYLEQFGYVDNQDW